MSKSAYANVTCNFEHFEGFPKIRTNTFGVKKQNIIQSIILIKLRYFGLDRKFQ
jgi:hypothetical protein